MKEKILVVDDEEDILQFLELVLSERGYRVARAASGRAALERVQSDRPDLVLLDVMMPEMDGWEVLRLLRGAEATARVPVALLSARNEARDRVQGLQEGALHYIGKPFSLPELFGTVENILGRAPLPARVP